jgi:hypothetical protein
MRLIRLSLLGLLIGGIFTLPLLTAQAQAAEIVFARDIQPILQESCLKCHSRGKYKGGLSLESRSAVLVGGESGPAITPGKSAESLLIERIASADADLVMPQSGNPLTPEQIALIRDWIDQGASWPEEITFGFPQATVAPRRPAVPEAPAELSNPIDRILQPQLADRSLLTAELVSDRRFARRVFFDLVGLLPTPAQLSAFEQDSDPNKRAKLVQQLLDNRRDYADHWLTFWNDALRNDYRGTGFIGGGRASITAWLYGSLYANKPYDQFVRELVDPIPGSEGFLKGIVWRGLVNASQAPPVQAAQNISQVFLGTNLKCASCHDSFVNQWKLHDAYALASVFSDEPLTIHRCDKSTGAVSQVAFIYPELGSIDAKAAKAERLKQLAALLVRRENGRFARTIVNRLWAQLFGRGIVEPIDDMDRSPWNADLLDWLADDLAEHHFDLKHTLLLICASRVYQLPSTPVKEGEYVFAGPLAKRLTAEQFADAVAALTGVAQPATPAMLKPDGNGQGGQAGAIAAIDGERTHVRAALAFDDDLIRVLGRPNREQAVTRRESAATLLQALEFTNGSTLDRIIKQGAEGWHKLYGSDRAALIQQVYLTAFGREPSGTESAECHQMLTEPPTRESIEDLLWAMTMHPEFQWID